MSYLEICQYDYESPADSSRGKLRCFPMPSAPTNARREGFQEEGSKIDKRKGSMTIFPRFHQWDAVLKLEANARANGAGRSYLVQHSAGSVDFGVAQWRRRNLAISFGLLAIQLREDRPGPPTSMVRGVLRSGR